MLTSLSSVPQNLSVRRVEKESAETHRPPVYRYVILDSVMFVIVFLFAGQVSLGLGFTSLISLCVPAVMVMLISLALCGAYLPAVTSTCVSVFLSSLSAFALSQVVLVSGALLLMPGLASGRFLFFFAFLGFFVFNTLRCVVACLDRR